MVGFLMADEGAVKIEKCYGPHSLQTSTDVGMTKKNTLFSTL